MDEIECARRFIAPVKCVVHTGRTKRLAPARSLRRRRRHILESIEFVQHNFRHTQHHLPAARIVLVLDLWNVS
jgi:hypothetical protein